jgi:hypothetical protein
LDTFGWILDDEKTGVFSSGNFNGGSEISLMVGLSNLVRLLKSNNVERLIIDVVGYFIFRKLSSTQIRNLHVSLIIKVVSCVQPRYVLILSFSACHSSGL